MITTLTPACGFKTKPLVPNLEVLGKTAIPRIVTILRNFAEDGVGDKERLHLLDLAAHIQSHLLAWLSHLRRNNMLLHLNLLWGWNFWKVLLPVLDWWIFGGDFNTSARLLVKLHLSYILGETSPHLYFWWNFTSVRRFLNDTALVMFVTDVSAARSLFCSLGEPRYISIGNMYRD